MGDNASTVHCSLLATPHRYYGQYEKEVPGGRMYCGLASMLLPRCLYCDKVVVATINTVLFMGDNASTVHCSLLATPHRYYGQYEKEVPGGRMYCGLASMLLPRCLYCDKVVVATINTVLFMGDNASTVHCSLLATPHRYYGQYEKEVPGGRIQYEKEVPGGRMYCDLASMLLPRCPYCDKVVVATINTVLFMGDNASTVHCSLLATAHRYYGQYEKEVPGGRMYCDLASMLLPRCPYCDKVVVATINTVLFMGDNASTVHCSLLATAHRYYGQYEKEVPGGRMYCDLASMLLPRCPYCDKVVVATITFSLWTITRQLFTAHCSRQHTAIMAK
ncbi:hypothetical protein J6590_051150 [Homalodisca vitripennis]|nr:hypothetical protein J6590_051150 [Homalodisca vitripennis]